MTDSVVTVIDTYETEQAAVKAMHRYAINLRRLRRAGRYGVFVEKRAEVWYLCLSDRYRPPSRH